MTFLAVKPVVFLPRLLRIFPLARSPLGTRAYMGNLGMLEPLKRE